MLSDYSDDVGKQGIGISFWLSRCACWGPPKPRTGRTGVQSNTPSAWLLSRPVAAPSRTSARGISIAFRVYLERAGDVAVSPLEIDRVTGSIRIISRPSF